MEISESFTDETSSLHHQSSVTQHNSEKHHKSSETQSFTVEIRLMVEKERTEVRSETKADTTEKDNEEQPKLIEQPNSNSVNHDKNEDDWSSADDCSNSLKKVVSTLRERDAVEREKSSRRNKKKKSKRSRGDKRRSRSKSKSTGRYRRNESPEKRRRSPSRDKRVEKRSKRRNVIPDRHRRTSYRDARRSRSPSRQRRDYTPERSRRSNSRDRRSRSRNPIDYTPERYQRSNSWDARRSRSRSLQRRSKTPDRFRRSNSRDRRSRSRNGRDYTPERTRRSNSWDARRSKSRSQTKGDHERRSPRTLSNDWIAKQLKNIRENLEEDNATEPRYRSTDNRLMIKEKASSSGDENSNASTEIFDKNQETTAADQQSPEIFSRNSTIGILKSRIQSSLSQVFSKQFNTSSTVTSSESGQRTQSVRSMTQNPINSSSQSIISGGVDDSIINAIVSRETSSKSNINVAATDTNIQTPVTRNINQCVEAYYNYQPPAQTGNMSGQIAQQSGNISGRGQTVPQTRDPRIQKFLQSSQAPPTPSNSLQIQPYGTLNVPQVNPATSHIYNPHTAFHSPSNPYNNVLLPATAMNCPAPRFNGRPPFQSQNNHQHFGNSRGEIKIRPAPMTYGEYKKLEQSTSVNHRDYGPIAKPMPTRNWIQNIKIPRVATSTSNAPKRQSQDSNENANEIAKTAVIHEERRDDMALTATSIPPKKPEVRELPSNVNAANESALNTLRDLINPQQLIKLVGLMEQMTENNSLAKVTEALEICANDNSERKKREPETTSTSAASRSADQRKIPEKISKNELEWLKEDTANMLGRKKREPKATSTSAASRSADQSMLPKKRPKNELDRLHEDIDNMFIRDGVLSANGTRRRRTKVFEEPSVNDDDLESSRDIKYIPNPPRTTTMVSSVTSPIPPNAMPVSSSQRTSKIRNVVKNVRLSRVTDDDDWLPNKCVPAIVLKKLPEMASTKLVRETTQKPRIKNNNLEMHSLKKIVSCQMCDSPPGISLISHYINAHPDREVLTSRLPPEAAQFMRSLTPTECLTVQKGIFKRFCYFCNVYRDYSKQLWIDHLIKHTGYFPYKCSLCSRKFGSRPQRHLCGSKAYVEKLVGPVFMEEHIKAYVCELCNFVRLYEHEMERHLRNEHEDGEAKAFKEFTILSLPTKQKRGPRPRQFKREPESDSEVNTPHVVGDEHKFEVQPANSNKYSSKESRNIEEPDFKQLTEKLEQIYNEAPGNDCVLEENYDLGFETVKQRNSGNESGVVKHETANEDDWDWDEF